MRQEGHPLLVEQVQAEEVPRVETGAEATRRAAPRAVEARAVEARLEATAPAVRWGEWGDNQKPAGLILSLIHI